MEKRREKVRNVGTGKSWNMKRMKKFFFNDKNTKLYKCTNFNRNKKYKFKKKYVKKKFFFFVTAFENIL